MVVFFYLEFILKRVPARKIELKENSNRCFEGADMKIVFAGVATLLTASVLGVGVDDRQRVEEVTARMERLAAKLEHTKRLVPETVASVAELIHRYDCKQHSCSTVLETRNHAARIRLQRALYLGEHTGSL
jgi:hypothetical protein